MSENSVSFEVKADLAELERLREIICSFGRDHDLPDKIVFVLNLVLDELITNSIKYGHLEAGNHLISVRIAYAPEAVTIEVEDDGCPFNPLTATRPDIHCPIEERGIGGLGLHLVRSLMDEMDYERFKDKNIVRIRKKLIESGSAACSR